MCIFCKIANHEIPSNVVYEDESVIAILDANPLTEGHTLVIPKTHCKNLLDVNSETLNHLISTSQNIAQKTIDTQGRKGFNLVINNNAEANQTVDHLHIHLIYRDDADEIHHLRKK